jgi:carboxymethylenebutenolidase
MIEVAVPGGTAEAYVARPDPKSSPGSSPGPHPGVLFYMDAFGVRPQIEEMADRIASWGYVVLVPNVFHRHGTIEDLAPEVDLRDRDAAASFFEVAFKRVRSLTGRVAGQDAPAYVDALRALPGVAEGPVGVTGYCMGARMALRTACLRPDAVAACGGFHGGSLATDAADSPHLGLPDARARFFFGHADNDRSMQPDAIARLDQALDDAGLEHETVVYPGAPHGYTMADTASYDEAAAEQHFDALRRLLDRTVGS